MPVGQVKRNQITNAGLEPLTGWLELRSLDIHGTKVTDRGLQDYLAAMPRLQRLSLAYLNIGDAGIESLDTLVWLCLLYTSPSPRDLSTSRMPSSA